MHVFPAVSSCVLLWSLAIFLSKFYCSFVQRELFCCQFCTLVTGSKKLFDLFMVVFANENGAQSKVKRK